MYYTAGMSKRDKLVPGHVTVAEAQQELNVSRDTLYRWLRRLNIKPKKVAAASVFSDEDIARIKAERENHND